MAYRFVSDATASPMCELGWNSLGVQELTALPSIAAEVWATAVPRVANMAATVPVPTYEIDETTAIKGVDGAVEVVSEGH